METHRARTELPTPDVRHQPAHIERCERVAGAYGRPRQREFAMAMLGRSERAVDYLEQAPCLLLAVSESARHRGAPNMQNNAGDTPPLSGRAHDEALKQWGQLVQLGWRLPRVMAHYRLAAPLRAIRPVACKASAHWPMIIMSNQMTPAQIAPIIPRGVTQQSHWLMALCHWYRCMLRRAALYAGAGDGRGGLDHRLAYTRWAAAAFAGTPTALTFGAAEDVADFAIARGSAFDTSWTLTQAADHCGLWHQQLAAVEAGDLEARFEDDPPIDYAPFPDVWLSRDGLRIVALRTARALFEEGRALKHCVFDYYAEVAAGRSRIFSVRRADTPVGTFELSQTHTGALYGWSGLPVTVVSGGPWHLQQSQGGRASHADRRPALPGFAEEAVRDFLDAHCPGWRRDGGHINCRCLP